MQQKLQNIHSQLINVIQPFVQAALMNEEVSLKQSLGMEKLTKVIDKYRFANYRDIIYFMRDLKAKNVYNFARSRLFQNIAKSRRFIEINSLFDQREKHLDVN